MSATLIWETALERDRQKLVRDDLSSDFPSSPTADCFPVSVVSFCESTIPHDVPFILFFAASRRQRKSYPELISPRINNEHIIPQPWLLSVGLFYAAQRCGGEKILLMCTLAVFYILYIIHMHACIACIFLCLSLISAFCHHCFPVGCIEARWIPCFSKDSFCV